MKSSFFKVPLQFLPQEQETILSELDKSEFKDRKLDQHFKDIKIIFTTYRIKAIVNQDCYLVNLMDISKMELQKTNFWYIYLSNGQEARIKHKNSLEKLYASVQDCINGKSWIQLKQNAIQVTQSLKTAAQLNYEEHQRLDQQKTQLQSAFIGNNTLVNKAKDLLELAKEIKNSIKESEHDDELDSILQNLGCTDNQSSNYIEQLQFQLIEIINKTQSYFRGVIPLLDLLEIINRKRTIQMVCAHELFMCVKAMKDIRLMEFQGVKVIIHKDSTLGSDIWKIIEKEDGLSMEDLERKLKISQDIIKMQMDSLLREGTVVVDDRLEGKFYFKNLILNLTRSQ